MSQASSNTEELTADQRIEKCKQSLANHKNELDKQKEIAKRQQEQNALNPNAAVSLQAQQLGIQMYEELIKYQSEMLQINETLNALVKR
jgi:hypothetical protein